MRGWAEQGATLAAACIGTFVLAESGLLDHHQATTSWWLAPLFRKRYPSVMVDESNMLVRSGKFVTAGAALSHIDLALWLIRLALPRQRERELLLLAKTTKENFDQLEREVRSVHSYETPEIIALPISAGSRPYLEWLTRSCDAS